MDEAMRLNASPEAELMETVGAIAKESALEWRLNASPEAELMETS